MTLKTVDGLAVYSDSVVEHESTTYFLARDPARGTKWLGIQGSTAGFEGTQQGKTWRCPLTPPNAAALRERLPWLKPSALGLRTSAGFGDRLGQATPGHVQAVRGTRIAPIFAQQSVRENARTRRTPQQVIDDALWGIFQAGWHEAWGADADHLKTPEVVTLFVEAGYSFYTVDPGDHVDNQAETDPLPVLREKAQALPWDRLDSTLNDLEARFMNKTFDLGNEVFTFDQETLYRAAAKYGRALAHIVTMYRHLKELLGSRPFDFEVSVDETDTPTAIQEHFFLAAEMRRLGVEWVSLAPRFVGRFEKGVDYIGDLDALDRCLAGHAAVMRHFGGYKLSLHSGSDKFSVYPLAVRHAGELVHLKTAGTSYLEALRTWAEIDAAGFREVFDFARGRYDTDRATYHVSADVSRVPAADFPDLPDLLNQFDARQVLHVTFGSVLDRYGDRLQAMLRAHEDHYYALLQQHFSRHLQPFTGE
jgi:hypothetical protein